MKSLHVRVFMSVVALAEGCRVVSRSIDIDESELAPELCFDCGELRDQFFAGIGDERNRRYRPVRLDFQLEVRMQRVGDLVSGENTAGVVEQFTSQKGERSALRYHASRTYVRSRFAIVWSSFIILKVAALGILVSSVISTLRCAPNARLVSQRTSTDTSGGHVLLLAFVEDKQFITVGCVHVARLLQNRVL